MININTKAELYLKRLLKIKPYYINEVLNKINNKYPEVDACKVIRKYIINGELNDKRLAELDIDNLVNYKHASRKYIYAYFGKKNISLNLVNYLINNYGDFERYNYSYLYNSLKEKGKDESYIINYLKRKGFEDE